MRPKVASALALLVLLALNGGLFLHLRQQTSKEHDRRDAVAAARAAVPTIFTYSPADVSTYESRALPLTAKPFSEQLRTLIDEQISVDAKSKQTTIRTTVEAAAVVHTSDKQATVMVYANQWRTDRTSSTPLLNAVRMEVTLRLTGDGWKVSVLKAI